MGLVQEFFRDKSPARLLMIAAIVLLFVSQFFLLPASPPPPIRRPDLRAGQGGPQTSRPAVIGLRACFCGPFPPYSV